MVYIKDIQLVNAMEIKNLLKRWQLEDPKLLYRNVSQKIIKIIDAVDW